jgi:hypothetical protein
MATTVTENWKLVEKNIKDYADRHEQFSFQENNLHRPNVGKLSGMIKMINSA